MTNDEVKSEIAALWDELRSMGQMLLDLPQRKIGMPYASPYEGVCFPVQDGEDFAIASIPAQDVTRFAVALLQQIEKSAELDAELDAAIDVAVAREAT